MHDVELGLALWLGLSALGGALWTRAARARPRVEQMPRRRDKDAAPEDLAG